jgi:hypothetical protein
VPRRKTLIQRLLAEFDPRCGARTKHTGQPCKCRPVSLTTGNGRCKWHGGMSTGPKTPEGRAKARSKLKQYANPKPDKPLS